MLEHRPSIVGEALKGVRPGLDKTVGAQDLADLSERVAVESAGFGYGEAVETMRNHAPAKVLLIGTDERP